ncbi:MAG: FtsX-like permease family protein [Chloroflexi bacterium]|nr:FtsX-like permease family protein [Chloroflexota bacterium]
MLSASLLLVARRTAAHARLLSAVVIGVVLAVTVMASASIYFDSLRNIALDRSLDSIDQHDLDIEVQAGVVPITEETRVRVLDAMRGTIIERMRPFLHEEQHAFKTWTFLLDETPAQVLPGQCPCRTENSPPRPEDDIEAGTIACDCGRMSFMTVPFVADNIVISQGRFPDPALVLPPEGETYYVEVALDAPTADLFGLVPGSELRGKIFWNDIRHNVTARLVGIYERTDTSLPLWRIYDDTFAAQGLDLDFARFVVSEESIVDGIARYFPGMGADFAWILDTNPRAIDASQTAHIRRTLEVTNNELRGIVDSFVLDTELGDVLDQFEADLFFNRLPMFVVLILIVLVVLYYVVTLASLLVDAQRSEVALLRSRGATSRQILAVFVIEAGVLSGLAVIIGPLLAMAGVSAIGLLPFYEDLNGGGALPVRLTASAYQLAVVGGVLSMLALFVPAIRAARLGLLNDRRSRARPPRLAFIQRYYLDLGILGVVLFLFWQLTKQGSFVATDVFGEEGVDNLVLAIPALFLVAAGVVLLRVFPVTMDLTGRAMSSRFGSRIVPPSVVLGVWQMARSPASHSRLSLLLILTAGLGVFAASFATTLERSATEQVLYNTGADLRVPSITSNTGGQSFRVADILDDVEGIVATSSVYRETGSVSFGISNETFDLLGVEAETFPDVAWFRDDFASGSIPNALRSIEVGGIGGILLPEDGFWLSALIRPLSSQPDTFFVARLSDANNRYYTILMGILLPEALDNGRFRCAEPEAGVEPGWCRVGARVAPLPVGRTLPLLIKHPVRLHSIGVVDFGNGAAAGAVDIDDIAILNRAEDQLLVIEEFDDLTRWRTLEPSADSLGDTFGVAADVDGNLLPGVARFRWTAAGARELRGISVGREEPVMPVLASHTFMDQFGVSIGDPVLVGVGPSRIRAEIRGTINLFPTLKPDERPFLVADLDAVHESLNLAQLFGERQPNEVWLRTEAGDLASANRDGFLLQVEGDDPSAALVTEKASAIGIRSGNVIDRSSLLAQVAVDPLVSAGWQALLGISFLTVLVVSAIGFLVHVRVSFSNRRGEFALLRTMGLSMNQLLVLVVLEQVIVIGVAVGIGLFMGTRLGDTIIPFLANSGEDKVLVPPMVLQIDWAGFGLTFGLLGIVFTAVIIAVLVSVYRMSIHRVMRMGDG